MGENVASANMENSNFVPFETFAFFDGSKSIAGEFLSGLNQMWEVFPLLAQKIAEWQKTLDRSEYTEVREGVFVHKTATVAPTAYLGAPCIIGAGTEVRHCAFIRGAALVGRDCVVGNSVELKNCILFDGVQVPHYNYVGDSVLGYRAHMGAGSITSNIKSDRTNVTVKCGDRRIQTNLRKFGALIGDFAEIGCNCVLNPGTIVGAHTSVYPLLSLRGFYPQNCIVKSAETVVPKH